MKILHTYILCMQIWLDFDRARPSHHNPMYICIYVDIAHAYHNPRYVFRYCARVSQSYVHIILSSYICRYLGRPHRTLPIKTMHTVGNQLQLPSSKSHLNGVKIKEPKEGGCGGWAKPPRASIYGYMPNLTHQSCVAIWKACIHTYSYVCRYNT